MRRTLIFCSLLLLPVAAFAQRGGGMQMSGARPIAITPHMMAPHMVAAARSAGVAPRGSMRMANSSHGPVRTGTQVARSGHSTLRSTPRPNDFSQADGVGEDNFNNNNGFSPDGVNFNNVPGLGFDYSHLAAISGPHFDHRRGFGGSPFGFGGFLLGGEPYSVVEEPQQQPGEGQQAAADDSGSANDQDADNARRDFRRGSSYVSEPQLPPAPQHDVAEYVFVQRDGGLVFAVAYSWEQGTLRYVTREGTRRSLKLESIDLDATQQFNEQRGLTFRTPA